MGDAQLRRLVQQPTNPRVARLRPAGRIRGSLLWLQPVSKSGRFGNNLLSRRPARFKPPDVRECLKWSGRREAVREICRNLTDMVSRYERLRVFGDSKSFGPTGIGCLSYRAGLHGDVD